MRSGWAAAEASVAVEVIDQEAKKAVGPDHKKRGHEAPCP
jgi:hypothetical protein